jgi:hypothetical protein
MKLNLLIMLNILKEDINEVITFSLMVRDLDNIHKIIDLILIDNIVNKKKY